MTETNQITLLEREMARHKAQANLLENAAAELARHRNNITGKKIRFEGNYALGGNAMSRHTEHAYKAFLGAWHQLGPGLIRAAELDLMAQARAELEKARAIERQLAPIYAAVQELVGADDKEDGVVTP